MKKGEVPLSLAPSIAIATPISSRRIHKSSTRSFSFSVGFQDPDPPVPSKKDAGEFSRVSRRSIVDRG